MVVVSFNLFLATKPSVVKFEVEGTATLTGKDDEISKMLDVDPETKVPYVFQRVYQYAFTAMYLLSTILHSPAPPNDLLFPQREGVPVGDISVETKRGEEVKEREPVRETAETPTPRPVEATGEGTRPLSSVEGRETA